MRLQIIHKVRAAEQPVAVPGARSSSATRALLRGRLADPPDGETREAGGRRAAAAAAGVVAEDPPLFTTRVHDVSNPGDRQRRLRDVRGDDDEPVPGRGWIEHQRLLLRGEHGVQREHVHRPGAVVLHVTFPVVAAAGFDGGRVRADPLILRLRRLLRRHPFAAVDHDVLLILADVARAVVVVGHLVEIVHAFEGR